MSATRARGPTVDVMIRIALLVLIAACGRFGFEATTDDGSSDAASVGVDANGAPDATAATGVIWAATFAATAEASFYGFSEPTQTANESTFVSIPGAGPHGQDIVQYHLLPTGNDTQPYIGWRKTDLPPTPQGETRYVRLLIRVLAPCDPTTTSGDVWMDQLVVLGGNSGGLSHLRAWFGDPQAGAIQLGGLVRKQGGAFPEAGTESSAVAIGEWHWVQWELRSSSARTTEGAVEDGRIAVWIDQATYAAPTSESDPLALRTDAFDTGANESHAENGWADLALGSFVTSTLAAGSGPMGFQVAAFEYAGEFDPSWRP
jgi:hypothetical protein